MALQVGKELLSVLPVEASRHVVASTYSAMLRSIVELQKAEALDAVSFQSPCAATESFAWELRRVADRIRRSIADHNSAHCTSFHDAHMLLRQVCVIPDKAHKLLEQLNSAETMLKHCDRKQLGDLEASVENLLNDETHWKRPSDPTSHHPDDSLVEKPANTCHIVPPPLAVSPLDPWASSDP